MPCCDIPVCEARMIRKQFIAGARCPKCNAEDKVKLCREDEREWLECVACGHTTDDPGAPEHPNEPVEAAVGIVRFPERK
jgi:uncharacterized metal-binding protein (TIGR02443 family)